MKIMPFEDHRKQNDTIQSRMVRLRRSGVSSCATVTPGSATSAGAWLAGTGGSGLALGGLLLDFGDGALGFRDAALADEIAGRFRHEDAHEEEQHSRNHAGDEDRAPAVGRDQPQADQGRQREADRERRHHRAGHAAADAGRAVLRRERQRDRHLAAKAEVRQEAEDGERQHVPRCADEPGEQREDADGRGERGAAADVVGDRAPEQRAEERADQPDGCQQAGLRRIEPELARHRRQRHAEQREVKGVEHDAEEADGEEIAVPLGERQPVEPRREFSRFLLRVRHPILPSEAGLTPALVETVP